MKPKTVFWIAVTGFGLLAFGLVCPPPRAAKKTDTRISTAVNSIVSVPITKTP
jgi:hypothetical protein